MTTDGERRTDDERRQVSEVPRIGPVAGAAAVGAVVLGAAAVWGATGTAIVAGTMYNLLRKRPPLTSALGESAQRLSSSLLVRLARSVVGPRSVGLTVIRATDTATAVYFAYRVLAKELARSRRPPVLQPSGELRAGLEVPPRVELPAPAPALESIESSTREESEPSTHQEKWPFTALTPSRRWQG
jgi:hypothetical protein